jgi:hypothetical protein
MLRDVAPLLLPALPQKGLENPRELKDKSSMNSTTVHDRHKPMTVS